MTFQSNNPPPAAELFAEEIDSLRTRASEFGEITQANMGDARDLIGLAKKLAKDIDTKRADEKKPHLDAGREIDSTYNPLKESALKATAVVEKALTAFVVEQKRKAEEARREAERKAAEEAERARKLQDDALLADDAAAAAKAAENEAKLVAAEETRAGSVKGSEGFRAAGLRTIRKAKITNPTMLVTFYMSRPEVIELCERLANADIRAAKGAQVAIPGIEIVETEQLV